MNSTIASFAYKSRTKNFRKSQNSGSCIFRSVLADGLKYSLFFIHQTPSEMAGDSEPSFVPAGYEPHLIKDVPFVPES